jgi:two-component system cell cycle response regulator DivK
VSQATGRLFLYVEDDALSRQVMQLMVDSALLDVRLVMFEDSRDFIPRLRALERQPDIILMDVHLKPVDGFALLALLRDDAAYRDACVIALTASVMNEEIEQLRTSGFDGAIGKPISVTTFPDLVRRILAGEKVWHVT